MKCDSIFLNHIKDTANSNDIIICLRKIEGYSTSQYIKTYKDSNNFQVFATNHIALISCKISYRQNLFTDYFKL